MLWLDIWSDLSLCLSISSVSGGEVVLVGLGGDISAFPEYSSIDISVCD